MGPYTLLAPLGAGGMAQVFVAQRDGASTLCVLKVLHASMQSSPAARRFQREAHIASLLDHPNIGPVLDAGWHEGKFFLTMPVIDGETVEDLARAAGKAGTLLPLPVSLGIVSASLAALENAHDLRDGEGRPLKLVHRDLSPRNIMVGYDGRTWVIDFGVAKGELGDFKTSAGVLVGTPYYMSPEQAQALPADHRSDLYTIGTVLYELITGQRLANGAHQMALLMSVIQKIPEAVTSLNAEVPAALDAVMVRALAKDPNERFQSASEFRLALLDAADHLAPASATEVGACMLSYFPDGPAKVQRRLQLLRPQDGDLAEPTRAAPAPQSIVASSPASPPRRGSDLLPVVALLILLGLGGVLATLPDAPAPLLTPATAASVPVVTVPSAGPTVAPRPTRAVTAPQPPPPSPNPQPAVATEPELATDPEPAQTPRHRDLKRRYRALTTSLDKAEALRLAKDLQDLTKSLSPEQAGRLQIEADRVFLTSNVDTMLQALGAAMAHLPK